MGGGTGTGIMPEPEIYLAIFGDKVRKHFDKIKGFLKAREIDGIVEEYVGGSMPLSHFELDFGYWEDKGLKDIINTYIRQFVERTGLDYDELTARARDSTWMDDELTARDNTWTPTIIRARVVDIDRTIQLAQQLRNVYKVETAIYSPFNVGVVEATS